MTGYISVLAASVPWLAVLAMGLSLLVLLVRYAAAPFAPDLPFGPLVRRLMAGRPLTHEPPESHSTANRQLRRRLRRNEWALHRQLQIIGWVVCLAILSRLMIFAAVLVSCGLSGDLSAFFNDFRGHWVRWDAAGYLALAKEGYTAANQANWVLLPFYPMVVRLFSLILFGNVELAAFLVSNLSLLGVGWALYLLVQEKQRQICARRALLLLMFCPMSVFLSVQSAESLFIFLTLMSILFARRQKFLLAVLMGMLAAFTRLAGILTIIPILLEVFKYEHSIHLWPRHKGRCVGRLIFYTLTTLLVSLGFFAYLWINRLAGGDMWAFVKVQAETWNQEFGSLANTLRYSIEGALTGDSMTWRMGVWIPQSLIIILSVALLTVVSPWADPGDGLYAWGYLALTLAPTWLLTGPRMVFCMYALYPLLTRASRKRGVYAPLLVLSVILMVVGAYMYAVVGNIL